MAETYRVTMQDGAWKVLKDGAKRAVRRFDTRQEAVDFAGDLARRHAPAKLFLEPDEGPATLKYTFP